MSVHWHTILTGLFGWPGTWGTGGNMVAWVICGTLGLGWLHAKEKARHLQRMAQAARHHQEQMALAAEHHQALKEHVSAQLAAHCADLRQHISAQAAAPERGGR